MNTITIPENHQEFIRNICKLARDAGLRQFAGTISPSFNDPWRDDIQFRWDAGRHNEDAGEVWITSTHQIRTKLEPK